MITKNQLDQIRNLVGNYHTAIVIKYLDPSYATQEKIQELKNMNYIPPEVTIADFPTDAYMFGKMVRAVDLAASQGMAFDTFLDYLKSNPIDLTNVERQAIIYAKSNAAHYITGLGDMMLDDFSGIAVDINRAQKEAIQGIIREELATGIGDRSTWGQVRSAITNRFGDYSHDFDRIVFTEMQNAMSEGQAADILEEHGGEALVAHLPRPDACSDCVRLYVDPLTGKPKIFKLSQLIGNGTNIGKKRAGWLPIIGSTHPWCMCILQHIGQGYEFDSDWNLIPTPEEM